MRHATVLLSFLFLCACPDDDKDSGLEPDSGLDTGTCVYYYDRDGDGYGDPSSTTEDPCGAPPDGYVENSSDCDDDDPSTNPGGTEVCGNEADEDCDGVIEECDPAIDYVLADTATAIHGEEQYERLGIQAAGGGDVNGDGQVDILLGAQMKDGYGLAYVFQGPFSGEMSSSDDIARMVGSADHTGGVGFALDFVDNNADGYDDLLFSAFCDGSSSNGITYVIHGPVTGYLTASDAEAELHGESEEYSGNALANLGDATGDGVDDVAVGAEYGDRAGDNSGVVYVAAGPQEGSLHLADDGVVLSGEGPWDKAGSSVSAAGDVDGDDLGDILVGAPHESTGAGYGGTVYLVLGASLPSSGEMNLGDADAIIRGTMYRRYLGSTAGGGDTNGDGYDDVLVGITDIHDENPGPGEAYLFLGPVTGEHEESEANASFHGEEIFDEAGNTVELLPDVNGDGLDDILVGAHEASSGGMGNEAGAAYLVLGPATGSLELATADARFLGECDNAAAGVSVAAAGDTDGDGNGDFIVGAEIYEGDYDWWSDYRGAAYIVQGFSF